jgi:hypothetical protein
MAGLGAPSGGAGAWSSLRLAIRVSHRPVRTASDRARPRPTHLREPAAASLLRPAISRNARFADCSANNVGVTARFVTNPELTDDTDVTRWVLVPRVTY